MKRVFPNWIQITCVHNKNFSINFSKYKQWGDICRSNDQTIIKKELWLKSEENGPMVVYKNSLKEL